MVRNMHPVDNKSCSVDWAVAFCTQISHHVVRDRAKHSLLRMQLHMHSAAFAQSVSPCTLCALRQCLGRAAEGAGAVADHRDRRCRRRLCLPRHHAGELPNTNTTLTSARSQHASSTGTTSAHCQGVKGLSAVPPCAACTTNQGDGLSWSAG